MSLTIQSPSVFSTITTSGKLSSIWGESTSTKKTECVSIEAVEIKKSISIEDFISELTATDPRLEAALEEGTRWVSKEFYSNCNNTFKKARLDSGLSQCALARKMNTSQSYIAKIEKGSIDVGISVISRLADALNLSRTTVFEFLIEEYERNHSTR